MSSQQLSWKTVGLVCAGLAIPAILIASSLTVAQTPDDPIRDPSEHQRSPTAQELKDHLTQATDMLNFQLRKAAGDLRDCGNPCLVPPFYSLVDSIITYCAKVEPTDLVREAAYDQRTHEPLAGALQQSCALLQQGTQVDGAPADEPEWRARVGEAGRILASAIEEEGRK